MPHTYDLYNNNCQSFVIRLLDAICRPGRTKVRTNYSLTSLQIGYLPEEERESAIASTELVEAAVIGDGEKHAQMLSDAQAIMTDRTPKLKPEDFSAEVLEKAKEEYEKSKQASE
jgi:hypothetical protein